MRVELIDEIALGEGQEKSKRAGISLGCFGDETLDGRPLFAHALDRVAFPDSDALAQFLGKIRGKVLGAFGPALGIAGLAFFEPRMLGWPAVSDLIVTASPHAGLRRLVAHHPISAF